MDTKNETLKIVKAYPNIALIKYWGKYDIANHLPYNSSLSIGVDTIYTLTYSKIIKADSDIFYLNGKKAASTELIKMTNYLDKVRQLYNRREKLEIHSKNFFPTAAGLASSASGYTALAKSLDLTYELNLSDKEISKLARIGSVSASRSIYGGFVYLEEKAEFAEYFANADDYCIIFIIVNENKKEKSSRNGMKHTVETSDFYSAWLESTKNDFAEMKKAILEKDFSKIGRLAESSCLKMHATMLAAKPAFTYLKPKTLQAIDTVKKIRENCVECYFTIDAGPNVKVLCKKEDSSKVYKELLKNYSDDQLILCGVSNGYEIIEGESFDNF